MQEKQRAGTKRNKKTKQPAGLKAASLKPLLERISVLEASEEAARQNAARLQGEHERALSSQVVAHEQEITRLREMHQSELTRLREGQRIDLHRAEEVAAASLAESLATERQQAAERTKQLESRCAKREQEFEAKVAECDTLREQFEAYRTEMAARAAAAAEVHSSTTAEQDAALEAVKMQLSKSEAKIVELQALCDAKQRACEVTSEANAVLQSELDRRVQTPQSSPAQRPSETGEDGQMVLQLIEQIKVVEMEVETEREQKEQLIVTQEAELDAARTNIAALEAECTAIAAKNQTLLREARQSAEIAQMASDIADEHGQEMKTMIAHLSDLVAELAGELAFDARDQLPPNWPDMLLTLKRMVLEVRSAQSKHGDHSVPAAASATASSAGIVPVVATTQQSASAGTEQLSKLETQVSLELEDKQVQLEGQLQEAAAVEVQRYFRGAQIRKSMATVEAKAVGSGTQNARARPPHAHAGHPTIDEVHEELQRSGQTGTFSLANNVASGDTRAVDPAYTEIQRVASERGISFDDARLLYTQRKNLEAGEYTGMRAPPPTITACAGAVS